MRQIHAIPLRFDDEQTVTFPVDAVLLSVQMTGDTATLFVVGEAGPPAGLSGTVIMRHTLDSEGLPEFPMDYAGSVQEEAGRPWLHFFVQSERGVDSAWTGLR
jgi:hypothetical protein